MNAETPWPKSSGSSPSSIECSEHPIRTWAARKLARSARKLLDRGKRRMALAFKIAPWLKSEDTK